MTSTELKHQARQQKWVAAIQNCRSSGLPVRQWCKQRGITPSTYYRWEREVLSITDAAPEFPGAPAFAELPAPKQQDRNVSECSATLRIGNNNNHEADIPMQRKACHRFAEEKGWTIVHEEQEEGVSGHKVRAENRDKLQIIKEMAMRKEFDILLVFMFDRIGRIADETPFVVEWFVNNGVEVSTTKTKVDTVTAVSQQNCTAATFP